MRIPKFLDWRLKAIIVFVLMALGGFIFFASSIRSTIASYLGIN